MIYYCYIFSLCALKGFTEVFSSLLGHAFVSNEIKGIQVARNGPIILHLLFADDSIIFSRASRKDHFKLKYIFEIDSEPLGTLINFDKSAISFSKNTSIEIKNEITQELVIPIVEYHDKYLYWSTNFHLK